jgi:hypothetical protein
VLNGPVVLQETLQGYFTRLAVDVVHNAANRLSGQANGLETSQVVLDNPWIGDFISRLNEELSDKFSVNLPEHFVDQVFRLFDVNADGAITKQEWVSKCNVLTTEGTDQRISALFTLIDEDGDGLLSEVLLIWFCVNSLIFSLLQSEVLRVISDALQLANEAIPVFLTQLSDILVDRISHRIYAQLQIP